VRRLWFRARGALAGLEAELALGELLARVRATTAAGGRAAAVAAAVEAAADESPVDLSFLKMSCSAASTPATSALEFACTLLCLKHVPQMSVFLKGVRLEAGAVAGHGPG
jgi:hypothetical protein